MKLYTAFVCAVMMFALSAHAGPAPREVVIVNDDLNPIMVTDTNGGGAAGNSQIEFLGFSDMIFVKGNAGLVAIRDACGLRGVGAHMCTTAEIMDSTLLPEPSGLFSAWVRSSPIADAVPTTGRVAFLDASGLLFEGDAANCSGWNSDVGLGMTVSPQFTFSAHECGGTPLPVACCGVGQ